MFKHLKQLTSLFAMIAVLFAFTTEAMAKKSKTLKNTQKKGFVHLNLCPQIKGNFSPDELAIEIDLSIQKNFKLWDTNHYAYNKLNGNNKEADKFLRGKKYFDDLSSTMTNRELEYIMLQYANPIKLMENKL